MDQQEILWRQYSQTVELYKFYMDLMVKFNVFYYAVTGAILSFFFANPDIDDIEFALGLPLIMSVAFAAFFVYGAIIMKLLRREVFDIRNALGLRVAPDVGVLSVLPYIFASVFLIVATGCAYLIWRA